MSMKQSYSVKASLVIIAFALFAQGCRRVNPVSKRDRNMRQIQAAFIRYWTDHEGDLPSTLSELTEGTDPYLDRRYLLYPTFPAVPGSSPPSSYRYVPCEHNAPPDRIILYPNVKATPFPLCVLRHNRTVAILGPKEYEREIRALGEDYDILPEPKWP